MPVQNTKLTKNICHVSDEFSGLNAFATNTANPTQINERRTIQITGDILGLLDSISSLIDSSISY